MRELVRDRVASTLMSVLLHLALIGALAYGWWTWHERAQPPVPALAINATVVDPRALGSRAAPSTPPPPPAPVAPAPTPAPAAEDQTVAPPPPDAQEAARKEAERQAEQKQAEQKQAEAREQAQRQEAERAAAQRQEQERKAREAQEAKQREQQRLAEAKREAEQKRKQQQEAAQLAQSQAELQQGIAEDERALAVRSGPEMVSYRSLIQARIQNAWIRPPTAREGLDCTLDVTQVPGGQVVNVKLGACNGDAAVRQSILDAVYRASPLPAPPDPALFARELEIEFKPTD
ncbi:MAG TPA: cell envelope integrity protein TolA [Steroidobacteraceae bacterium]|nr:cell envelope integrity protein TolA [Steroidobacteraceae bacterium]